MLPMFVGPNPEKQSTRIDKNKIQRSYNVQGYTLSLTDDRHTISFLNACFNQPLTGLDLPSMQNFSTKIKITMNNKHPFQIDQCIYLFLQSSLLSILNPTDKSYKVLHAYRLFVTFLFSLVFPHHPNLVLTKSGVATQLQPNCNMAHLLTLTVLQHLITS